MAELVQPRKGHRPLEIGTGSGYQAAILSRIVTEVYSIEIIESLRVTARERLALLGNRNVEVRGRRWLLRLARESTFGLGRLTDARQSSLPR